MRLLVPALLVLTLSGTTLAFQEALPSKAPVASIDAEIIASQLPSYPLNTCPISHEDLMAMSKVVEVVHEGRLVRLCCKSCTKEFKKDPAATIKMIDDAVIQAQKGSYPLTTCVISGEELGSMDGQIDIVHGTRLVRLCCKGCVKGFQKEPAKHMATVNAALIAQQKKSYPLNTCLVSNEPIEGDGFDHLYGTRLVRFCCEKCAKAFEKEPAKFLATLEKATPKKN